MNARVSARALQQLRLSTMLAAWGLQTFTGLGPFALAMDAPQSTPARRGASGTDISVHLCPDAQRAPPKGFVDLRTFIPSLRFDIRYHGTGNFTGDHIAGYGAPGAWLLREPAEALARIQKKLSAKDLGLIIYDAYRPRRGTDAMAEWAYRTDQEALLNGGYIARRSRHNHGTTVDLGLVDLATGKTIFMGTDFDTLTPESRTRAATGQALKNRMTLKAAMESEGFKAYFREWWHFQFDVPGSRPRDVPYGKCESDEPASFAPSTVNPAPAKPNALKQRPSPNKKIRSGALQKQTL